MNGLCEHMLLHRSDELLRMAAMAPDAWTSSLHGNNTQVSNLSKLVIKYLGKMKWWNTHYNAT